MTLAGTLAVLSADISLSRFSDLPTLIELLPLENNLIFVLSSEWMSLMAETIGQLFINILISVSIGGPRKEKYFFVLKLFAIFLVKLSSLPDPSSEPKMTAVAETAWMLCIRDLPRRLKFIRAGTTPILVQPNQSPMYSSLFSMNRATESPCWNPALSRKLAN